MGRRISDSDPNGKTPCAFCRTMRVVMLFAIMVVALMAYANKLELLKDINFTSLFGYSVVLLFLTVLAYRVWDEYGRPKKSLAQLESKRAEREKQFDELDAKEALDAERLKAQPLERSDVAQGEYTQQADLPQEQNTNVEVSATPFSVTPEQLDLLGFSTPKKPD